MMSVAQKTAHSHIYRIPNDVILVSRGEYVTNIERQVRKGEGGNIANSAQVSLVSLRSSNKDEGRVNPIYPD